MDLMLSQSACTSITIVNKECVEFIDPLQSALEDFSHDSNRAGQTPPKDLLSNEPWYADLHDALKIRAGVLRLLLASIELLYLKNEQHLDDTKAQSSASTLKYRIVSVKQELHAANGRLSKEVR